MKILISNSSQEPIYEQITTQIRDQIIKGTLEEGFLLPSIRGLARELQISVITTKRSYEELEKEGFIETVPGKGSYVAPQNLELLKEKKLKIIEDKLAEIVDQAMMLRVDKDEIINIINILFEE
ncbi:MAG: GntR family transcriptional regulator [Eubacteriales bacterium]|jgi:GntR family transcriptional regulator|nr:GntR family transcriptional regulator [Eubacteriales bacterium]